MLKLESLVRSDAIFIVGLCASFARLSCAWDGKPPTFHYQGECVNYSACNLSRDSCPEAGASSSLATAPCSDLGEATRSNPQFEIPSHSASSFMYLMRGRLIILLGRDSYTYSRLARYRCPPVPPASASISTEYLTPVVIFARNSATKIPCTSATAGSYHHSGGDEETSHHETGCHLEMHSRSGHFDHFMIPINSMSRNSATRVKRPSWT